MPKEERTKELKSKIDKSKEEKTKEKELNNSSNEKITSSASARIHYPANPPKKPNPIEYTKITIENNDNFLKLEDGQEIIIKDSEIKKYIEDLYKIFILWSLSIDFDFPFNGISLENSLIKKVEPIDILFSLIKKLKNRKLIINFLTLMEKLTNKSENCYQFFFNINILSAFLDISFDNYKLKGKEEENCYNIGKNIVIASFINSFAFCEKQKNLNHNRRRLHKKRIII